MLDASIGTRRRDIAFLNRTQSPVDSTFSVSQILPRKPYKSAESALETTTFIAPPELPKMSSTRAGSISPDAVFDPPDRHAEHFTDATIHTMAPEFEPAEYDLKPPPPSVSHNNMETLAERFFSNDHLNLILRDPSLHARFASFVTRFKPECLPSLKTYIEHQKVVVAVEYANAVAARIRPPHHAAVLGQDFEAHTSNMIEDLLSDALPSALTHQLVRLVCETLVKEITQTNAPIMREMIPSLAEVYCVTDPSNPDNPIVYASEGNWMIL